jgi:hypothetical protein
MQFTAKSLTLLPTLLPAALVLSQAMPGQAVTYSYNPLEPTELDGLPTISIVGSVSNTGIVSGGVSPESQYVTFNVPSGYYFASLVLEQYDSTDPRGFIGLMAGNQWTTKPSSGTLPGALAYNHFGAQGLCALNYVTIAPTGTQNCVNDPAGQSDLLKKTLGAALSGPLLAGDYTLWIQQTKTPPVNFTFKATFAPVPGPAPFLGLGAGLAFSRRLRQRRSLAAGAASKA